jgi:hypothetical protein
MNLIQSHIPTIYQTNFRYTLVRDPLALPFLDATNCKLRMQLSFDPTSPSTIGNIEIIAASFGSFTMVRFSGARVTMRLVTPGCTRDTDEKKQCGEFHIHIAKLVTRTLQ